MPLKFYLYLAMGLALCGTHWMAFHQGGEHARREAAEMVATNLAAQARVAQKATQRAIAADKALQEKLNEPQAAPEVRTVVRSNPSTCRVPAPVYDSLQKHIDSANSRIASSL